MDKKELQRKRMITYFVEAANKIIEEEGIENVTLRKVSDIAGYNSATLYNYFHDLDHLLFFASMKYLKKYTLGLSEAIKGSISKYDLYIKMWRFFCSVCFENPKIYHHIFFGKHSYNVDATFKKYYEIFPDEFGEHPVDISSILLGEKFIERNKMILLQVLRERSISEDKLDLINEMTFHIYHSLLVQSINDHENLTPEELGEKMIQYIEYITK